MHDKKGGSLFSSVCLPGGKEQKSKNNRFLSTVRKLGQQVFVSTEGWFNALFGSRDNPFYHLGALSFYFYYIVIITGIYLFIYFEPSIEGGFETTEFLTHEQWYLGGMMRSLHRYSSDALVLTMILHAVREFFMDRYRENRWFSWFTGGFVVLLVFPIGVAGYWLIWDKLGQFVAVRSSEWLDWLPIIAEPMARNFLTNTSITDLFFRLIFVVHIGLSLFLLVALLVHLKKISKADIIPPRQLAWGTLLALLILSFINPITSHDQGNLSSVPMTLDLDWFFLFAYPLMDIWSMGTIWLLVMITILLLLCLPWLPPVRREHAAEVWLDECSGCGICIDDCPYEAITLQARTDGHLRFTQEPRVIGENCVKCGICTGSCPSSSPFRRIENIRSGIDLPQRNIQQLRTSTRAALESMQTEIKVIVFSCDHSVDPDRLKCGNTTIIRLPCIGALPVSMIGFALHLGADGVFLVGCRKGDCHHRLGITWAELRISGEREPFLHRWVPRNRIGRYWAAPSDHNHVAKDLEQFCQRLGQGFGLPPDGT